MLSPITGILTPNICILTFIFLALFPDTEVAFGKLFDLLPQNKSPQITLEYI